MSTKTRKGNRYLRRALLQGAWAATRKKDSYLRAFFNRLMYRKGWGKAIIALGHKLLVVAYGVMKTRTPYYELGGNYYDQLNPEKTIQKLVQRLGKLGVEVTLTPREGNA